MKNDLKTDLERLVDLFQVADRPADLQSVTNLKIVLVNYKQVKGTSEGTLRSLEEKYKKQLEALNLSREVKIEEKENKDEPENQNPITENKKVKAAK